MARKAADPLQALEKAQDFADQAWTAQGAPFRTALAWQAVQLSPLCADAFTILALGREPGSPEALALWEQAVAAGMGAIRAYGLEQQVGDYWAFAETRPYMGARQGFAEALWAANHRAEAAGHLQAMLRLNPNDNQGVRYPLLSWLITLDDVKAAKALLRCYKDDWSAFWLFGAALLAFRESGPGPKPDALLAEALAYNPHVAPYLLGRKRPPKTDPDYYEQGEESEAVIYVRDGGEAWRSVAGAVKWLEVAVNRPLAKRKPGSKPQAET